MTRALRLFALFAIAPAALHAAPVMAGDNLLVPICTGDGQVHTVQVPVGGGSGDGDSQGLCCAKGCHTGGGRKRVAANN